MIDMARKRFHRAALKFLVAVWLFGGVYSEEGQDVLDKRAPAGCYQIEVDGKTVAKRFF